MVFFDCNICLEAPADPVLTCCGHLYCWPCLFRWMQARKPEAFCPICKVQLSDDKIIPIFGRGETSPPVARAAPCSNITSSSVRVPARPAVVRASRQASARQARLTISSSDSSLVRNWSGMLHVEHLSSFLALPQDTAELSPEEVC